MSEVKTIRINKVLRELNISLDRAVEQLGEHGFEIEARPTSKISQAWEILDVGRASISNPCSPNCSTARSKEIFNSRRTLLIRMVLTSDICYIGIQK